MIHKGAPAHRLVHRALRLGGLVRLSCEVCDSPKTDAHHRYGYDRPLEVAWLCRIHHVAEHGRGSGKAQRESISALIAAGCSQSEIARRLGITRQRVHQILHQDGDGRPYGAAASDRYRARRRNLTRPETAEVAA